MRLWHKDMIPVLPRQQLLSQWRECCCIARNIAVNGTPNHILVNKVLDYPYSHFSTYAKLVEAEMQRRGYSCNWELFAQYRPNQSTVDEDMMVIFEGWHNNRYLQQCFYNLEEKYDCGGISKEEWQKVVDFMSRELTGITI